MKICDTCKIPKPATSFSKSRSRKDGLQYTCKDCAKVYRQAHKKEAADYNKVYRQAKVAKMVHSASVKKYYLNYPEKLKARSIAVIAVRSGELKKSVFCESCGLPVKTHGHHADYSKPLEVDWLCRTCHNALHVKRREKILTNSTKITKISGAKGFQTLNSAVFTER